jgi:hypothetical protein
MKNNLTIFSVLAVFAACAIYFYASSNITVNDAARHISEINLDYYTRRGMVQKKQFSPEKSDTIQKLDLGPSIQKADAIFEKDEKMAAANYEQLLKSDPGNVSIHLRLGMLYLKLNQLDASKEHLYFVHENKDSGLQPDSAWFLALLNIKEQNTEKAKMLLEECVVKKCSYKIEAEALLQTI